MQELLTFAVLEEARIILSTAVWTSRLLQIPEPRETWPDRPWVLHGGRAEQNVLAMSARQKAKEGSKKKHLILKLILHASELHDELVKKSHRVWAHSQDLVAKERMVRMCFEAPRMLQLLLVQGSPL